MGIAKKIEKKWRNLKSNRYMGKIDIFREGVKMKKDLFWKIMTILFFLWICLWLRKESISFTTGQGIHRFNRITGSHHAATTKGWEKYPK